ncbi:MAG: UDP-2,3-diacylglucosamine diphosphatase LpxI [Acidaminococcales bacterium]|jgi:DUF1009 family protein|nr:UDP-2,3-diacylglucosamine diphosphatase LpxI [Acidaminococcales bacterium]
MATQEKIGLLAGIGFLPIDFARAARGMGFHVTAIGLVPDVEAILPENADKYFQISAGKINKIIKTLKKEGVTTAVMLGKVSKEVLYKGFGLDFRAVKLLLSLPNRSDDTIMLAIVAELEKEGIKVMEQTRLLSILTPPAGVLSRRAPTEEEAKDIDYGFKMALAAGQLDIGQTVVVKNQAIMAVEAIEGTDACIKRGGILGGEGVVVAKTAKPGQDFRFDMPSVGLETIKSMVGAGAKTLVVEAGRTLFVQKEEALRLADKYGIAIVARAKE